MIRSIAALALALAVAPLAGCASETAQAKPAPVTAQTASTPDDQKTVCVANMTKSRECTDVYIPALVDARAQADTPPGIADAVKKDRNGVIAQAMEEWKTDSQDANINTRCEQMAGQIHVTPEDLAAAKDCNAKADCQEFTSCSMPLFAKYFRK
jgi:hypothetical protein